MKLYLVFSGFEFEGHDLCGVFLSKNEAEVLAKKILDARLPYESNKYADVEEWTVGEVR